MRIKKEQYVRNIRQSSERMREMLNTLLSFFRQDNGKEQPNISPCRISAITHILKTEFLKEMYAQEGVHCDTCTDAAELMEMIRWKEYSLLLTDLNMPEINGFELLELLRTSNVDNSKTFFCPISVLSRNF